MAMSSRLFPSSPQLPADLLSNNSRSSSPVDDLTAVVRFRHLRDLSSFAFPSPLPSSPLLVDGGDGAHYHPTPPASIAPSLPSTDSTASSSSSPPVPDRVNGAQGGESERAAAVPSTRPVSCVFCHRSKVRCQGGFPCHRCSRQKRGHLCVEWKTTPPAAIDVPPAKRSRTEAEAAPQSLALFSLRAPLLSSTSFPFTCASSIAYTQPLPPDTSFFPALLSRHLLRGGLSLLSRNPKPPHVPMSQSERAFKILRLSSFMSHEDVTTLVHAHNIHWKGNADAPRRLNSDGRCDGSVCSGWCLWVDSIQTVFPVTFSYATSPTTPLDDLPYGNHPTLLLQRSTPHFDAFWARLTQHVERPSTALKLPPPPSSPYELAHTIRCNRAFERLFGYTQSELRRMWMKDGFRGLFRLVQRDWWEEVGARELESDFREQPGGGWDGDVGCVDKWGRLFPCFMTLTTDVDGHRFTSAAWTFIPRSCSANRTPQLTSSAPPSTADPVVGTR